MAKYRGRPHPDVKQRVMAWLLAEGYKVTEGQGEGAVWALLSEDQLGRKIMVVQGAASLGFMEIQGSVTLSDDHKRWLANLEPAERDKFLWDLRFALLNLDADIISLEYPLEMVGLGYRVPVDGMRHSDFVKAMKTVRYGIVATIWSILRKIGQPAPLPEDATYGIN